MRKTMYPHFADEEAEVKEAEVDCPRPHGFVTIEFQSLWVFHAPKLPWELTEQGFPG